MTEKIEKLIKSGVFEDTYIGLSLFNKLNRKDQLRFLRKNFERSHKINNYSWKIVRDIKGVPLKYMENSYIVGRFYSYIIRDWAILLDSPCIFRRFMKFKKDPWEIIEDWRKNT